MKKLLTLVLIFTGFSVMAGGPYKTTYTQVATGTHQISFDLGQYRISQGNFSGQNFSLIKFASSIVTNKEGYAELPFLSAAVQLGDLNNVDLTFEMGEYTEYKLDYPLLPSRGTITRDQDPATVPYKISTQSLTNSFYPETAGYATEPYIMRDVRGTNVFVYPFRYNAATQTLRVYKNMTVKLVENNEESINPLLSKNATPKNEMSGIYSSVFINYERNRDALAFGDFGDIHIVTTSRDEDAILPYIQWKKEKGFKVSMETVPAGTNATATIQAAYNANPDIMFVLVLGDWEQIQCNRNANNYAMDPQLGCVVGTDEVADIFIGRFSGSSAVDITTQVNKTISYEKNPDMAGTWYKAAIGIGSNEGGSNGDDSEIDYDHQQNIWDTKLSLNTFDTYYNFYDPGASNSGLMDAWNGGVSVVNYAGHGDATSFVTTGFNTTNANALTNSGMLPWVCCVGCNTGNYVGNDCLGEAVMANPNGGAIAYLGGTIFQPWAPPMRGQDYFMDILTGGFDYDAHSGLSGISTTEQRTTSGAITYNGFMLMTSESGTFDDWNCAKTWIHFGDPSVQLRTDTPDPITSTNTVILTGADFETVIMGSTGPIPGASVTISANDMYFTAISDAQGGVTIPHTLDPGAAKLVVTAFNTGTIYEDVTVIAPTGPYLVVEEATVNGLQSMPFGQTGNIDITIENVGSASATNVHATLTTTDIYITNIVNNTDIDFGEIAENNGNSVSAGSYTITFANNVPDGHIANLHLIITEETRAQWEYDITVKADAPALSAGSLTIDDTAVGNSDGILDIDETADLVFETSNIGHADVLNAIAEILSVSTDLTLNSVTTSPYSLAQGGSQTAIFNVTANSDVVAGTIADITLNISAGAEGQYTATENYEVVIGFVPEYCPAGADDSDEFISQILFADIDNSSTSGETYNDYTDVIGNVLTGQTYDITVTNGVHYSGDQMGFWADWNYDGDFEDDGEFIELSYANPNGTASITIPQDARIGNTRMRLRVMYTGTLSPCGDASWGEVEDYTLAIGDGSTIGSKTLRDSQISVFPNPSSGIFTIQLQDKNSKIEIFDLSGKTVYSQFANSSSVTANLSNFSSGIYYIKVSSNAHVITKKIVLK